MPTDEGECRRGWVPAQYLRRHRGGGGCLERGEGGGWGGVERDQNKESKPSLAVACCLSLFGVTNSVSPGSLLPQSLTNLYRESSI